MHDIKDYMVEISRRWWKYTAPRGKIAVFLCLISNKLETCELVTPKRWVRSDPSITKPSRALDPTSSRPWKNKRHRSRSPPWGEVEVWRAQNVYDEFHGTTLLTRRGNFQIFRLITGYWLLWSGSTVRTQTHSVYAQRKKAALPVSCAASFLIYVSSRSSRWCARCSVGAETGVGPKSGFWWRAIFDSFLTARSPLSFTIQKRFSYRVVSNRWYWLSDLHMHWPLSFSLPPLVTL